METKPNYYLVLGVNAACDDVVIHAAYRALMIKYHPDKNKDANANYRSASINEAFKVLGNTSSRKLYDFSMGKTAKCCSCESRDHFEQSDNKSDKTRSQDSISSHRARKMAYSSPIYNIVLVTSAMALTIVAAILLVTSASQLGLGDVYAAEDLPDKTYLPVNPARGIKIDYEIQDIGTNGKSGAVQAYIDDRPQDILAAVNSAKRFQYKVPTIG